MLAAEELKRVLEIATIHPLHFGLPQQAVRDVEGLLDKIHRGVFPRQASP